MRLPTSPLFTKVLLGGTHFGSRTVKPSVNTPVRGINTPSVNTLIRGVNSLFIRLRAWSGSLSALGHNSKMVSFWAQHRGSMLRWVVSTSRTKCKRDFTKCRSVTAAKVLIRVNDHPKFC